MAHVTSNWNQPLENDALQLMWGVLVYTPLLEYETLYRQNSKSTLMARNLDGQGTFGYSHNSVKPNGPILDSHALCSGRHRLSCRVTSHSDILAVLTGSLSRCCNYSVARP